MSDEMVDPETGELVSMEQSKLWSAFIKAQAVMEAPKRTQTAKVRTRDGGPGYEFSYAPLDEIVSVARAALTPHGLGFNQEVIGGNGAGACVRTRIIHGESGQYTSSLYPIIADASRAQGFGSGVTYARRYGLMLALGIVAEEDDDANSADQNRAEITNRGQQQQRPQQPQTQRPHQPQTQQRNGADSEAAATVKKVRAAILAAETTEQLNAVYTPADEKLIKAQRGGPAVWEDILKREGNRRLELVAAHDAENQNDPLDEFLNEDEIGNALR